ncbi:hypothetical protein ACVWY0_000359 [Arthrobacter sp. UYNi723]
MKGVEYLRGRDSLNGRVELETYIPQLEAVGFLHHLREPGWFEHRLVKHKVHEVNLHVFTAGCEEATRMIRFRDSLRSNQDARIEYEQLKRRLADQEWTFMQDYADAKGSTIRALLAQYRWGAILSVAVPIVPTMEYVVVKTAKDGSPTAVVSNGREWAVGADAVRWFERVSWWEAQRRMPKGLGRVDVEVLQVQVRLGRNPQSALTTMVLERDGLGGGWRLRESVVDVA